MPITEEKGFDLLLEICKVHSVPILIISSNNNIINKVPALRMGADDYLIAPFEDSDLVTRVYSLIRYKKPKKSVQKMVIFHPVFCPFFILKPQHIMVRVYFLPSEPQFVIRIILSTCLE
jgi:DNA-binding response OmpR family regulator